MTAHFVNITELPVDQEQLVEFFNIAKEGKLIDNQLKLIMEEMLQTGASASDIIKEKGFDTPEISESDLRIFCRASNEENAGKSESSSNHQNPTLRIGIESVFLIKLLPICSLLRRILI